MTCGKVEAGSAAHEITVTINNDVAGSREEMITLENAICKAMCSAVHRLEHTLVVVD